MPEIDWLVVDIETEGDPWTGRLLSIAVCDEAGQAAEVFDGVPDVLRDILADPGVGTVEHTLYDARWLRLAGYEVNGPIADTRVMAWNVNENTDLDLESLVWRYLGKRMDKRLRQVKNQIMFRCDDGVYVPFDEAPRDQVRDYNSRDTADTAELFRTLRPRQPRYWDDQIRLTTVLLNMECAGLPVDMDTLEWTRESYEQLRNDIEQELRKDLPPGFNLNSGDQVAAFLFLSEFDLPGRIRKGDPIPESFTPKKEGRLWTHGTYHVQGLGLRPGKWTDSGARPKTDAKTLAVKYGKHPWVSRYLEYAEFQKLLGTYLEGLPRYVHNGRLYGTFNQAGTVSGRLSSANPNLQNLPRRGKYGASIRSLFAGDLVIADFSQLEPRLMAHFSQDPELLRVFIEGKDIYKSLGHVVFPASVVTPEERDICKGLVLSMGYGAQARKLAEILSVAGHPTTQSEAQRYLQATRAAYPRFFEWREEVIEEARTQGYILTLAGRPRRIGFDGVEGVWKAERQAVNSKIQGSAADIVNGTMLEVAEIPSVCMLVQVHDELVCEVISEPDLAAIQQAGEKGHGYTLTVPLVFEPKRVKSWGEK